MNASPIQPASNEREELARLLPGPADRDLPGDRHQRLQEFVMSHIHQDLRAAGQSRRRSPKRRLVFMTSALTAVVATAAALVIAAGGSGTSEGDPVTPAPPELSGQQILLAAATTAQRTPQASGTYWYLKVVSEGSARSEPYQWESWTRRDGQTWFRGDKTGGDVVKMIDPVAFRLGGPEVSFAQLQDLPTEPNALRSWIADALKHSDLRSSAGKLDANMQKQFVFDGLISLVSQLPAPPGVRAGAFQAIAAYPHVKSLGAVNGGQGLEISLPDDDPARLVVDPATSRIRETSWFVTADGTRATAASDGGFFTLVAEWTDVLPG